MKGVIKVRDKHGAWIRVPLFTVQPYDDATIKQEIAKKQDILENQKNIKSINNKSLIGPGNIVVTESFDITDLFNASQSGDPITETFKDSFLKAIEDNNDLYICDKSAPGFAITLKIVSILKSETEVKLSIFNGETSYSIKLDLTTLLVTAEKDHIGEAFNRFNNNENNSIFELSTQSTNDTIQQAFTTNKGDIIIPSTGDVIFVYETGIDDTPSIKDSGIVLSRTETPTTQDLVIQSNNLVDDFYMIHHIKLNYEPSQGLDSLRVEKVIHTIIEDALISQEKMTQLYADVLRNTSGVEKNGKVAAAALVEQANDLETLKQLVLGIINGSTYVNSLLAKEIKIEGAKAQIIATTTPKSEPDFPGQIYIDTIGKKAYMAVGNSSVSDWKTITN